MKWAHHAAMAVAFVACSTDSDSGGNGGADATPAPVDATPRPISDGGGPGPADARPPPPDGAAPPSPLEVGTGAERFEPLPAEPLPIHMGFQGGYHVFGGFRIRDIDPHDVLFQFALDVDGERIAEMGWLTDLSEIGGAYEMAGVTVVFFGEPRDDYSGAAARLSVQVTQRDGRSWERAADVSLRCCDADVGGEYDGRNDGDVGVGGGAVPGARIRGIWARPREVHVGEAVDVGVDALGIRPVDFLWTAESGTFDSPDAEINRWHATAAGTVRLRVTAVDRTDGEDRGEVEVHVLP